MTACLASSTDALEELVSSDSFSVVTEHLAVAIFLLLGFSSLKNVFV